MVRKPVEWIGYGSLAKKRGVGFNAAGVHGAVMRWTDCIRRPGMGIDSGFTVMPKSVDASSDARRAMFSQSGCATGNVSAGCDVDGEFQRSTLCAAHIRGDLLHYRGGKGLYDVDLRPAGRYSTGDRR